MEREPFTDEGSQDTYLPHAIHRRLSRPSSLPVFHIGPRPSLYSPFQVPYCNEGKYQTDVFRQQIRPAEFMTGDSVLAPQPRTVQNIHQDGSPKFNSPQFLGELRHGVGFGFQHSSFIEPKPFVNERDVNEYSPFSLKRSPLFPHDIPCPYEERKGLPYVQEARNSHPFSPEPTFVHQSSPFAFEKRQLQFHPSPVELKPPEDNERIENKSGGRRLDSRSDFHDEGYVLLNSQRQSLQRDFPRNPRDSTDLRDNGVISSQDCQLQRQHLLSGDRHNGGLSNHELNQARKSVICTPSKEAGISFRGSDSQSSPNELKLHAKRVAPNSVLESISVDRPTGIGQIDKKHLYLIPSPSKYSVASMDTYHSPSNLFESIFSVGDSRDQGCFTHSMEEAIKTGCHLLESEGYNLKAFREEFLVNNDEEGDLVKQACSKNSSLSPREMKQPPSNCSQVGTNSHTTGLGNKVSSQIGICAPQFVGENVEGNTKSSRAGNSSEMDSSLRNLASSDEMLNKRDGTFTEHNMDYINSGGKKGHLSRKSSLQNGAREEEPKTAVLPKAVIRKIKGDNKDIPKQSGVVEMEEGKGLMENQCVVDQGKVTDSYLVDDVEGEGGGNIKECEECDNDEIGCLGGEQRGKIVRAHKDSLSSEDACDDAVRKRALSREERAIQYAVERFKEMEERKLMATSGKRRGKGKRESKDQSTENLQNGEHTSVSNVNNPTRQNSDVKSDAQNTAVNRKRQKTVSFQRRDDEEGEHSIMAKKSKVNKDKPDICVHPKVVRKQLSKSKGKLRLRRDLGSLGEKCSRTSEKDKKLDKKQHRTSASLQDSLTEKDNMSRIRNDMQQKSYLLVPSYRGFKDFSPVVLEGRTRQRSAQSDTVKVGKQKFPILVVETVGEKQNKIIVNENEDLDAKVAKESLLVEKVFEHQDEIEASKALSAAKRLSCNRTTGETILHKAARLGYDDVVDIKIKAGANVNAKDNAGWTALHEACLRGKANVVRVLLAYGADPNSRSESGIRPLHDAIDSNNIDIIRLLLSYGADISLETYSGVKSFQLARSAQVKEFLKGYIGDIKKPALLENPEDYVQDRWHFGGTSSFLDGDADDAREIFQDFPAASDLQIEFVASTKEPLPTYNLPVFEDDLITGFRNYYILDDVLSCLSITRSTFLKKHKVELRVLRLDEMLSYINQSQIASLPDSFTSSDLTDEALIELVHVGHYAARRLFDLKTYQV